MLVSLLAQNQKIKNIVSAYKLVHLYLRFDRYINSSKLKKFTFKNLKIIKGGKTNLL